jgi:anaerobic selenocysteine-containing dehydrogenase
MEHAGVADATPAGEGFALYTGRLIYDEGAMVSRSAALRHIARRPYIELNDVDAKTLDVADGDHVVVSADGTDVTLSARISDIARGAVFVPYDQPGVRANGLIRGLNPSVQVRRA